uniref:TonB C-terminal domain-containing protein n=1 Tax=uncultured organism TaxID=155900 RepID=M1Q306_9ZZZZ|nr:hypothetical protein FLSS-16_0008 [uncultured organism]
MASILIHVLLLAGGAVVTVPEQPEKDKNTIVTEIVTTEIKKDKDRSDKEINNKDSENKKQKSALKDENNSRDPEKNTPKREEKSRENPEKRTRSRNRRSLQEKRTSSEQVLKVKERDEGVRRVMKAVKDKIDPIWQRANPPSKGSVMLEIAIDTEGRVAVLNGPELQNNQLGEYVYRMVRNAAPFETAMQDRSEPIRIECVFNIRDQ